jgi:HAUS augmin-like complex subunit 6
MSDKHQTIEEKQGASIFYNLKILKIAVKTTPEFDECISPTMFLKSNTKAFINVTHFLFNIIDSKEFKAKFYWPINDKRAEQSYR